MRTQGPAEVGLYYNLSGTGAVGPAGTSAAPVCGALIGFYVNSTSSGVIHLRDGGSSGIDMAGDITPAIGFHHFPAAVINGLHMTLVSGSINVTFHYNVGGGMAEVGTYLNLTGTSQFGAAVSTDTHGTALLGFYVNSTTGGTMVFRDGGSGGTVVSGTITPAAGTYHRFPCSFPNGGHVTIANTLNVTLFFQQGNS